ncbi:lactate racemase domain-containing protein [Haloferacaceae archaeon DSL9]
MRIPLGADSVDVDLTACDVTVAEPAGGDPISVRERSERAVDAPHGPALSDLAAPDDDVAIVVTDVTRATPDDVLVDALVDRLPVPRGQISIVLGLGLHRPMTADEIRDGLGSHADLAENHDPNAVVEVGSVDGHAVEVSRTVADADIVLATGMVEPHQYAGFSGGAKTVVIGAGSESMIRYTHGAEMLSNPGVRLGRIDDNPFREALDRAGDLAGPDFCLNVTHGPAGVLGVSAGRPRAVVRELTDVARDALSVAVDGDYDAVVAGVGAPKDANLYQATRAATYVALGAHNPLREGGRIVVPARLEEGAGEGTGERRFYDRFETATDARSLYESMKKGYEPGAQRAFVVARTLCDHGVYVTNTESPTIVEDCLMTARARVEDALDPGDRVLVVPDALHTLLLAENEPETAERR